MVKENERYLPKAVRSMRDILRAMGAEQYDERVIQQLLEFMHRYVASVNDEAKRYAAHASRDRINVDDVRLAASTVVSTGFVTPPPREFLAELAAQRNQFQLPTIRDHVHGLRLPPEKYTLSNVNYQVDPTLAAPLPSAELQAPLPPILGVVGVGVPMPAIRVAMPGVMMPGAPLADAMDTEPAGSQSTAQLEDSLSRKRKAEEEPEEFDV
ncbi:hypothetical protein CAOG_00952 [Capsaspora owczarzaki ATCC 30864]|uniref:Transcription initiation factor TFIID subunit 9 n=1 Tax=Capsaspora owczarzaki (strain ATCC 30864) TaxID=595528 RepID=A0A0D2U2T2_CAPO3|nr:hypothetical protein CAOG_00952 [Capsaspora owczarzaki ATCC 30864]KJE89491.1 hypothetical protein CAOG_000952 [Capsaspora owczarzaki ATCC 30864]|eukprot:XP_004365823.1 hypothetical protein CAOG_00952 [Capsaspora owczarzaki ATCC 30864]